MFNNAMGVTDDRSTKVGYYVATLAVVASQLQAKFCRILVWSLAIVWDAETLEL